MADSPAFDWTCTELENETDLDRLEARGTVRIALKSSGLEAGTVLPDQMRVVIEKVLPTELGARGVVRDDLDELSVRPFGAGWDIGPQEYQGPAMATP